MLESRQIQIFFYILVVLSLISIRFDIISLYVIWSLFIIHSAAYIIDEEEGEEEEVPINESDLKDFYLRIDFESDPLNPSRKNDCVFDKRIPGLQLESFCLDTHLYVKIAAYRYKFEFAEEKTTYRLVSDYNLKKKIKCVTKEKSFEIYQNILKDEFYNINSYMYKQRFLKNKGKIFNTSKSIELDIHNMNYLIDLRQEYIDLSWWARPIEERMALPDTEKQTLNLAYLQIKSFRSLIETYKKFLKITPELLENSDFISFKSYENYEYKPDGRYFLPARAKKLFKFKKKPQSLTSSFETFNSIKNLFGSDKINFVTENKFTQLKFNQNPHYLIDSEKKKKKYEKYLNLFYCTYFLSNNKVKKQPILYNLDKNSNFYNNLRKHKYTNKINCTKLIFEYKELVAKVKEEVLEENICKPLTSSKKKNKLSYKEIYFNCNATGKLNNKAITLQKLGKIYDKTKTAEESSENELPLI